MKHNNSDSQLAAALNKPGVMQGLQLNLPSMGEVSDAIEMLAKKSTAPDKECPDWMKADIRNGINWALNYVTKHNTSPAVGQRSVDTATCGVDDNGWNCKRTTEPGGVASQCMNRCVLAGSSCEG
jgi:hypothetical protein